MIGTRGPGAGAKRLSEVQHPSPLLTKKLANKDHAAYRPQPTEEGATCVVRRVNMREGGSSTCKDLRLSAGFFDVESIRDFEVNLLSLGRVFRRWKYGRYSGRSPANF